MVYYITKTQTTFDFVIPNGVEILPLITLKTCFVSSILELLLRSDSLIFTSKNAIFALQENLEHLGAQKKRAYAHWREIPNYVLGEGSARVLQDLGMQVRYVSKSAYGSDFAKELSALLVGKYPLFLRAEVIASSLPQTLRESGIAIEEAIVYANYPLKLEKPPTLLKDSIIFFGAPSHIKAFLLNYTWDCSFTALCIGKSTKNAALQLLGNVRILQSPKPNNKIALDFALHLLSCNS